MFVHSKKEYKDCDRKRENFLIAAFEYTVQLNTNKNHFLRLSMTQLFFPVFTRFKYSFSGSKVNATGS